MRRGWRSGALLLLTMLLARADELPLDLALPTANHALLTGDYADFYQVIERNVHGVISHPWEGGQYGFVRDPVAIGGTTIYTRFHEGIDIQPLQRDTHGEPLDAVNAIADGRVVYATSVGGASNYGRYVVVEHLWGGCPYYSLYAHLSTIAVTPGEVVRRGEKVAVMGHTGTGIDRTRAHVHLELNLLLNDHFEQWHDTFFKGETNRHGIYNGINLVGLDIARLFLALQKNPALTVPEFLAREEAFYKVRIPNSPNFELPHRYPWMIAHSPNEPPNESPASWEISFTRSGLPLQLTPSARAISSPEVTYLKSSPVDARYLTRGIVIGRSDGAHLSDSGKGYLRLFTFPD